jgi:hypothetical protein
VKVVQAKELVLELMLAEGPAGAALGLVDPISPDGDPGKFLIAGQPARAIHHFSGWNAPINLDWFAGSLDPPVIHKTPFHWYVFAIPRWNRYVSDHYFVCDYLQMRDWVLDFTAPLGNDHRDHNTWRADLRLYADPTGEKRGYFRWGDEPPGVDERPGRVFELDNLTTVSDVVPVGLHVGTFGAGGESAAHQLLKLYVANHQTAFGLSADATPHVEYSFATGDRVDVMFENHQPDRTVVEIEVEGERNICVGILQAIKYRSLAAADAGFPLVTSRVRSLVVAYDTDYLKADQLAEKYDIELMSVDRELVLAPAD